LLYIDDRDGSREMAEFLTEAVMVNLEFGDAMITGNGPEGLVEIGVERKTIGDLVNSITTGRLSGHQLPGLLESYYRVYLVVEGVWSGDPHDDELKEQRWRGNWQALDRGKRKFRANGVWSYLTTLEATGVVVRTTRDLIHTCQIIKYLERWWGKEWKEHQGHDMINRAGPMEAMLNVGKPLRIRSIAADLPHVGHKRSKAVISKFKTMEEMTIATEEEWKEIEGLGNVSAREIYKFIHRGE
jgi:ERCC4-type nuclease